MKHAKETLRKYFHGLTDEQFEECLKTFPLNNVLAAMQDHAEQQFEDIDKKYDRIIELLEKRNRSTDDAELPTIGAWLEDITISTRAYNAIRLGYCGVSSGSGEKGMKQLIDDVRSGDIKKRRNVGHSTHSEIANALRSSLKIDV